MTASEPSPIISPGATRFAEVRAITFDADDTLWPFADVMRVALQRVIEHVSVDHPDIAAAWTVGGLIATRDRLAAEHEGNGRITIEAVRRLSFVAALREVGVDDPALAEEVSTVYFRHRHGDLRPFDDVVPMFEAFAPELTVGLLTNGNTDPERSGLPGRFAFRIHADEVGVAKPDPAIFQLALDAAACEPHELLHVGDSLRFDIEPAADLGIRTAWLNRSGKVAIPPGPSHPDVVIQSLDELPALLA